LPKANVDRLSDAVAEFERELVVPSLDVLAYECIREGPDE
jgi:hypothetical protein